MSSAVPIHPLIRLARQSLVTSHTRASPARLLSPSSCRAYAKPSSRNAARDSPGSDRKNVAASASLSPSSTSSSSSRPPKGDGPPPSMPPLDSKAQHLYAASSSGEPASPPPPAAVKLTDNRSQQAQQDAKREQEKTSKAREDARTNSKDQQATESGGDQRADEVNVSKGASLHPRAVENDRRATSSKATAQQEKSRLVPPTNIIDGSTGTSASSSTDGANTGKVTEGIFIPHNGKIGAFGTPSSSAGSDAPSMEASFSTPLAESSGESKESSGGFIPPRSETRTQTGVGGSGPPAMAQISELGQMRPANPLHPFDTHAFIKRLEEAGFTSKPLVEETRGERSTKTTETSLSTSRRHDPAEAIMEALRHLLISRGERVLDQHISKTEVDNQGYLFTAALSELRTELQVRARNDAAALRSMVTLLQREVDGLNQKMREDTGAMKHDIQVDMNNRKGEAKEEQNTLEQEIQDLNNRFTISISDLKTEIEQNIKWGTTRSALTLIFGCIVILIATLTAADHLTREEVVEESHPQKRANDSSKSATDAILKATTRSAEDLGLVANYDDGDGSRYV